MFKSILVLVVSLCILAACCSRNDIGRDDCVLIKRDGNDIEIYSKVINGTNCIVSVYSQYGTSISCDWSKQ
jgi:hypothetical protein